MTVYVYDHLPPESEAVLQALYSRSPASILDHLASVPDDKIDDIMSRYYVGYGHASIGDCGTTTLFIEGVSMLAAKAIQDWPLYRGQEASTRYMDFSSAHIADPVGTPDSERIQRRWMEFYHAAQKPMENHLRALYPRKEDEKESVYDRAINARKFDILRGFLPAGATTNLSWHTDLRQASDHLDWMLHHPDPTIRKLSVEVRTHLSARYANSFYDLDDRSEEHAYYERVAQKHTYLDPTSEEFFYLRRSLLENPRVTIDLSINENDLKRHEDILIGRPPKAKLPNFLSEYGEIWTRFLLDFGSFRDLQRHRNGVIRMPLLTPHLGFHPWYLSQMPLGLREHAIHLIEEQTGAIQALGRDGVSAFEQQYYCAMGFRVLCKVTQSLPAFVYRMELRTSPSVHFTLRANVQEEVRQFQRFFPWITVHADMSPDTWDTRRGKQTIIEKHLA